MAACFKRPETPISWASWLVHVNRDLSGFATPNDTLRTGLQWLENANDFPSVGDNMLGGVYGPHHKNLPSVFLSIVLWTIFGICPNIYTARSYHLRVHNPWAVDIFTKLDHKVEF